MPNPSDSLKDTRSNQALNQMMSWLKQGSFKPGSKLPSQNELIETLGISRTGVREALQMMAALGLIEIHQGLGCFVKGIAAEYVINADVLAILLEKEAILEVMESRRVIESSIAALAAERAKTEDFWRMEDVLTLIERGLHRGESVAQAAADFHVTVAQATHNSVLAKLVQSFTCVMAKAGQLLETTHPDLNTFKRNELDSHRALYHVLKTGDPKLASIAMIEHIGFSESLVVGAFKDAESTWLAVPVSAETPV